ncbi:MAG TPA: hypothetical protein VMG80_05765 [Solirubrobacteraceae bacterium]|nr:hypothetical protein [Solirubrobacteraceae bacterium]
MRRLNVVLKPGSAAHRVVAPPVPPPSGMAPGADLAAGFEPRPEWNLTDSGGKKIQNLAFVNRYVGGATAWQPSDVQNIDRALGAPAVRA